MNLIQKLAKKVKNTIDEAILKCKFDIYIDKSILEYEKNILESKESIEAHIKHGNFDYAFSHYINILNYNKNIEKLRKFREYVLNEKYYDED